MKSDIFSLLNDSGQSKWKLWLLNIILRHKIPFNKPHGLKIIEVGHEKVRTILPYKKKNLNHLGGLHACALAAVGEFTGGIAMLNSLRSDQLRFIMKDLHMTYHYQGRMNVSAEVSMSEKDAKEMILARLESSDAVMYKQVIEMHDKAGSHICTCEVNWQIKKWNKVRTGK